MSKVRKLNTRAPLDRSPRKNEVERRGGLPMYIRRIANHLHAEKGMTISHAIAVAKNAANRMCASGDLNFPGRQNVNAGSRAEACAAIADWNARIKGSGITKGKGIQSQAQRDKAYIAMLAKDPVVKRYFSQARRETLRGQGKTDPHGGFPLEKAIDVKNAVRAIGRAKNPAMEKKRIIAAAKRFGCMHYIPDDWTSVKKRIRITKKKFAELCAEIDADSNKVAFDLTGEISKADDDQQIVFGWASVAKRKDGSTVEDRQGDIIDDLDAMERVAYDFVLNSRDGGEMHVRKGVSTLVESMVFTPEKREKMGIPDGILPDAWWVGFKVNDKEVWKGVKSGKYRMFSVHGTGTRKALADA